MKIRIVMPRARCSGLVAALLLLVCLLAGVSGSAQKRRARQQGPVTARTRIATLIRERVNEGVNTVGGVKVQTRTPPSSRAVDEIKRYGDEAVPILREYLESKNVRVRAAALEFLGLLGGERIVPSLQQVLKADSSPMIRMSALRWTTQLRWELVAPLVREVASRDSDEQVRAEANNILASHGAR
jgi:hypothetical protein